MQSQNRIPILSKSIEHFAYKPSLDLVMIDVCLIVLGMVNSVESNRKLDDLSGQLDQRINHIETMFWIKQQRLQIEVLGKIIVE